MEFSLEARGMSAPDLLYILPCCEWIDLQASLLQAHRQGIRFEVMRRPCLIKRTPGWASLRKIPLLSWPAVMSFTSNMTAELRLRSITSELGGFRVCWTGCAGEHATPQRSFTTVLSSSWFEKFLQICLRLQCLSRCVPVEVLMNDPSFLADVTSSVC